MPVLDQLSREKKERNRENTLFASDLKSKHRPTDRSKIAVVESGGICCWARPQHALISGPCRATGSGDTVQGLYAAMAPLSVGPSWASLSESQRQQASLQEGVA